MKCPTYRQLIKNYLYAEAPDHRVKEHVKTCLNCQKQLHEEEQISDALRSFPQLSPSNALKADIWQGIATRKDKKVSALPSPWLRTVGWSTVALVLSVTLFSSFHFRQEKGSTPSSVINVKKSIIPHADKVQNKIIQVVEAGPIKNKIKTAKMEQKTVAPKAEIDGNKTDNRAFTAMVGQPQVGIQPFKLHKQKKMKQVNAYPKSAKVVEKKTGSSEDQQMLLSSSSYSLSQTPAVTTDPKEGLKLYKNKININQQESTKIELVLTRSARVTIRIYSRTGRKIKTIVESYLDNGQYEWFWEGKNEANNLVGTGIYLLVFEIEGQKPEKYKLMVIK